MSIEVKNITYTYAQGLPYETTALDAVSFTVEDDRFVGVIGHTGSGKSTLLQHLNGLLKPQSGQILIDGTDITADGVSMIEIRKRIGLVFQYPEYQLFEETVARDVAYGPGNLGLPDEEIQRRVKRSLELTGLDYESIKDKSPFALSGGQRRRVAIAGVIAMEPEVLVLDEPTAGLDPKARCEILHMVETIHQREKNIIILVSHNMDDIARMADQVLVMDQAKLVMNGTPQQVFAREKELREMGLMIPEVTRLMRTLRQEGFEIREDIFTLDEAEDEILRCLHRGK